MRAGDDDRYVPLAWIGKTLKSLYQNEIDARIRENQRNRFS